MAEFRKQREMLRNERMSSAKDFKHQMQDSLKSRHKRFFSKNSNLMALLLVAALAIVAAQVWWIVLAQEPDGVRTIRSDTLDARYSNALASPTADQLETRISSLTANMQALSGLITNLESKLVATDQLEERISGLTEKVEKLNSSTADLESRQMAADKLEERISGLTEHMETLNSSTADLESRQMAADKLEERISGLTEHIETLNSSTADLESRQMAADRLETRISTMTKELQILSDSAAGLKSNQMAAFATTTPFFPVKQELVSRTNPALPAVAKEAPAIETTLTSVPATPDPKPVTDGQTSKRETVRTLPKERRDNNDVNEQPADSVPQNGPWTINLISSPDKSYAVDFSNTARSKGVRTELQEVSLKGTPYWRVQVTGFSTQGEAKAYADNVKDKLGLTATWIMKR